MGVFQIVTLDTGLFIRGAEYYFDDTGRRYLAESVRQVRAAGGLFIPDEVQTGCGMSIDGPFHNVLKIKPPIVFGKKDADFLLGMLEKVLREDVMRTVYRCS